MAKMTTDRTAIEWDGGPRDIDLGEGRMATIVELTGEYRGSFVAAYCDAGGHWSAEVHRRKFRTPDAGGVIVTRAMDQADAMATACDLVDDFEESVAKVEAEKAKATPAAES